MRFKLFFEPVELEADSPDTVRKMAICLFGHNPAVDKIMVEETFQGWFRMKDGSFSNEYKTWVPINHPSRQDPDG